ncbi:MAG TPA: hypothetical protein VMW92_03080 [Candidatus Heimdallarchaeota archaeon]|nr:hypothetical protein [Candidatus Heimdallarchaeota archaeon]
MQRSAEKTNLKFFITLIFILFWTVVSINASSGEDLEKKYAPILGDYSFDMTIHGYGVLKVTIYVENDKLLAITEISSNPGQMEAVEGKEFEFTIEDPDEGMYSIKFLKDDTGKYTKCHISNESMGMDVTGTKVE